MNRYKITCLIITFPSLLNSFEKHFSNYLILILFYLKSSPKNDLHTQAITYKPKIEIHEDQYGNIFINGCSNKNVYSVAETLELLKNGAKIRQTGSTKMNSESSRSHAIFTLNIKQKCSLTNDQKNDDESQTLSAKFHFVDLAGSERLKRTGATGSRAKEGICINRGLVRIYLLVI